MYIQRTIEATILKASASFPVVVVTGARQVGKTTVLKRLAERQDGIPRNYVSLDTLDLRVLAEEDPALFLQRFPPPLLIDEIQYAPRLMPYIKAFVDTHHENGLFWLTGSQQFHLMRHLTESLAGRAVVLRMLGLSRRERIGKARTKPFLPPDIIDTSVEDATADFGVTRAFEEIWRGSFPKLHDTPETDWEMFYDSYIRTYIERDIRAFSAVGDELAFLRCVRAIAARTGQLLNYADIAKDVGVSQPTVKAWLSLLVSSSLVYLLEPYSDNRTTRIVKTPKAYFLDTGLAAHLGAWQTPATLERGAMNGAFFESWVVAEILKGYWHNGRRGHFSFYRDHDQREIGLLIEENGTLYPIEIKKTAEPKKDDCKSFRLLEKTGKRVGPGAVLCLASTALPITESVSRIPVGLL